MTRSTHLALGALAATAFAGSAAADTVAFRPGFYAGGFVGWVNSNSSAKTSSAPQGTAVSLNTGGNALTDVDGDTLFEDNPLTGVTGAFGTAGRDQEIDGFSGGALVGYSVIGQGMFAAIEGDFSVIDGDKTSSTSLSSGYTAIFENPDDATLQTGDIASISSTSSGTASSKLTADGSVRMRFGTDIGYGMRIFATAGLAFGRLEHRASITKTDVITEDNANPNGDATVTSTMSAISRKWQAGWTLGGGLDVALWGPWSARVEYRYVDLGTGKLTVNFADGSVQTVKFEDTEQSVRFGLVYAF